MAVLPEMNYVVGRGRLYFNQFASPTDFTKLGERYLGDTPALSTTQASTDLKHYSSESGLKIMDRSITLQNDITGTFTCDDISISNLAFWYKADMTNYAQDAATGVVENFTTQPGLWYQLGATDANPLGVTDLASMTGTAVVATRAQGTLTFAANPAAGDTLTINGVELTFGTGATVGGNIQIGGNASGTAQALKGYINSHPDTMLVTATGTTNVITLAANTAGTGGNAITMAKSGANPTLSGATLAGGSAGASATLTDDDWEVDLASGRFWIPDTGIIAPESVVSVTYETTQTTGITVISSDEELYGSLRFVADNPVGKNTDYLWPYVKLMSNGEYQLKGDAWQQMQFSFDVLKLANQERVYARQRAPA